MNNYIHTMFVKHFLALTRIYVTIVDLHPFSRPFTKKQTKFNEKIAPAFESLTRIFLFTNKNRAFLSREVIVYIFI